MDLLKFFIQQQFKVTQIEMEKISLVDIRQLCEKKISTKKNFSLTSFLENRQFKIIDHFIDDDFKKLFGVKNNASANNIDADIFALFTSPISDLYKEILMDKREHSFGIQTGFYSCEYDIYSSLLMGFDCITLYVADLDRYQIQYLTEIARDYFFSIVFVVHNRAELEKVLETDAPYICVSCFEGETFKNKFSTCLQLVSQVPKTTTLLALTQNISKEKINNLERAGFSGVIMSG